MTQQHPIAPPPELVRHWSRFQGDTDPEALWFRIANEAAQWGADQELEACCEWMNCELGTGWGYRTKLRTARRPKPPSLKEQALEALDEEQAELRIQNYKLIRAVLESLPDNK